MATQVSAQASSSHPRKSRFSWVRKLVPTSRSLHSKTSSSPPLYSASHPLTPHGRVDGMSPVTTSSSLAPLYNHSHSQQQYAYSRDESLRTPSILTTSTSGSVNTGLYRGSSHYAPSRRRGSSVICDDRSSVDSNISLTLNATSATGTYVYNNVFSSATASTSAGTMTPHPSKRHFQSKLTPSITTTTTGTTTSRRSPSILSSSSSTNNTSLMTLPPGINHVTTSTANSINTSTSNYYYGDNASVITLASSSKRRRKSIDTNASTRALAPDSLFGNSRESLPLTVATDGGASRVGRSVSVPANGRRSISGSRRTRRTRVYDSGTESGSENEMEVAGADGRCAMLDSHDVDEMRFEKTSVDGIDRGRSPACASMT
ncbi:uncharacterized protein V1513DRAFT_455076 [Lipomyces chichibuensis]|uniref:uncharacterized protein n=1 Tax=Lipomyces chichibuensis TaxID=1546026 RepID=UPI003342E996